MDAQGAISTDALIMDEQGSQNVLKVHSLLDNQNTPVLVHGRMPQSPTECVVDAQAFGEDSIGTILTLSEENDEDTDEMFEQKTLLERSILHTMQTMSEEPLRLETVPSRDLC